MLIKKLLCLTIVICFTVIAIPAFSVTPKPPKNTLVATQDFKNVVDNSWTNLEFPKNVQPAGLYYVELSNVVGTIGCWGSKKNPYEDGPDNELLIAWQDDAPLGDGNSDFKLQYRPKLQTWVELIIIPAQAAISDIWNPFALHSAQESIGQTFLALESFDGVGLSTPTWNSANSGCTMTLYSAEGGKQAIEPGGKLSVRWSEIKAGF